MISPIKRYSGFSLLELMFTITLLGILFAIAIPIFGEMIRNNRVTAQNNDFVTALNFTRSEALRRARSTTLCASTDGATCSGATNWSSGWISFADLNADGALNGADVLLQVWPATIGGLTLNSTTRAFVRYTPIGIATGTETFNLLKPGCTGNKARRIEISTTGRVSTTTVAC